VTTRRPEGEDPVFAVGDWLVYEHANSCPRAWVVHEVESVPTLQDTYGSINENSFNLLRQAVVSGEPAAPPDLIAPLEADEVGREDQVEISAYRPGSIEINVHATQAGLLVVSESFYPGWVASVNGKPTDLHRANGVLMGVAVAKGPSIVTLRYSPRSFRLGAWITGLTLLAAVVWWFVSTRSFYAQA
jgi:hypothetical protein